ncbi:hypothetical protein HWC53_gp106 [Bacillus phage vB_BmeM-Goe8]|uniref:Uncharacterized protein n=1 Tax=Bacillus phage vB_BmeM-Goe8 TaxID=2593638 RepID=A0A516KN17_9CAUD|nr:hypothetical protein HWC53_gp106 [Bacillus phage vB_BmeM-Goe8]QDP42983.1 hypothetical protein Goe8_c02100 [Bacillus phage vB_BmeM-Goe8]
MSELKKDYFPESMGDLVTFMEKARAHSTDYNTAAEALSSATVAFFNYFASELGVTGFQASAAQLQFIGTLRRMKAFTIVNADNLKWNTREEVLASADKFLRECEEYNKKMEDE